MRVAFYARVSSHDQQTLPLQLDAMRAYAAHRGWNVALEVADIGSGALDRPKRQELVHAARRREIDVILVWRLDRWGRSLPDIVVTLRELSELGVGFVSLTEALDLTTPTGRAMAGLLAVFAEFERELIRERVKAGLAQARKRGQRLGRPITMPKSTEKVQELILRGVSKSQIARDLGVSRASVNRMASAGQNSQDHA
ncbi:MAG TPA: recombinase family protein [Bryobacteraceae bacterium]|nr:recombinase family protein [Bryobacteraceae bacterium]